MRGWLVLAGAVVLAGCGGGDGMRIPSPEVPASISVTSPAFVDGQPIPRQHTCRGAGRPPDLAWRGVPPDASSLALVVSDPDAPKGTFVHWVVYGLPSGDGGLTGAQLPSSARQAENSGGDTGWYPPCPPSGTHRYLFTVYAVDGAVRGRDTQDVLDEIGRRAVASGTLTGRVAAD